MVRGIRILGSGEGRLREVEEGGMDERGRRRVGE